MRKRSSRRNAVLMTVISDASGVSRVPQRDGDTAGWCNHTPRLSHCSTCSAGFGESDLSGLLRPALRASDHDSGQLCTRPIKTRASFVPVRSRLGPVSFPPIFVFIAVFLFILDALSASAYILLHFWVFKKICKKRSKIFFLDPSTKNPGYGPDY